MSLPPHNGFAANETLVMISTEHTPLSGRKRKKHNTLENNKNVKKLGVFSRNAL